VITRRRLLLGAAAVSVAAAGVYVAKPRLGGLLRPTLDTTYPLGILQHEEMRSIAALGETLAAPELAPPAEFFQEYVNAATQSRPGILKEYQRAAVLLNTTGTRLFGQGTQVDFADLPQRRREQVLRALLWQYPGTDQLVRKAEVIVASREALALRMYVMQPLIEHYYRSPFGWAVVGYQSFPGRAQLDPMAYTGPLPDKRPRQ